MGKGKLVSIENITHSPTSYIITTLGKVLFYIMPLEMSSNSNFDVSQYHVICKRLARVYEDPGADPGFWERVGNGHHWKCDSIEHSEPNVKTAWGPGAKPWRGSRGQGPWKLLFVCLFIYLFIYLFFFLHFHCHIWIQHENSRKMNINKPSIIWFSSS